MPPTPPGAPSDSRPPADDPNDSDDTDDPSDPAPTAAVRRYYETIDAGDYDALAALLAPDFVQRRPDRTLDGRETFVAFMRDERPQTDTTHAVDAVYERVSGDAGDGENEADGGEDDASDDAPAEAGGERGSGATEVAVRGRLLADSGEELFGFVDAFSVDGEGRLCELRTYSG